MKYWKRNENIFGTMDDNGKVPNSTQITKTEYDNLLSELPAACDFRTDIINLISYAKKQKWIPTEINPDYHSFAISYEV